MSAYKRIQTEYRSLESLKRALCDVLGDAELAPNVRQPSLTLYGYAGDARPERASIRIDRHQVNRFSKGLSNDIGFAWNGQSYEAIVSDYDQANSGSQRLLSQIKQRYALHELRARARAQGYTLREQTEQSGSINLVFVRR